MPDQTTDQTAICGEVGTSFTADHEPHYTDPCRLPADHDELHDWAQREAAGEPSPAEMATALKTSSWPASRRSAMSEEWVRDTVRAAVGTSPELAERYLHDPMYRVHAETLIRTLVIVAETLGEMGLDQAVLPVLGQTINKGVQKDLAAIEYRRAVEQAMAITRKQSYAHLIDQIHQRKQAT